MSEPENAEFIIAVFKPLGIDSAKFNSVAAHTVDVSKYWKKKLKEKLESFQTRYQAYLVDYLKDEEQCVQLYDQYLEEYIFLEPTIENTITLNIDSVFEDETGVSYEDLSKYTEAQFSELHKAKRAEIDEETWSTVTKSFSQSKIDAHLIFGEFDELTKSEESDSPAEPAETASSMQDLVGAVFSTPANGFSSVGTEAKEDAHGSPHSGTGRKHSKRIHSEATERKQQEYGVIGEAIVFKGLSALYPDARWISGNAEKAKRIIKGDDTCGYDIKYTDENGVIQYVEVKASKNADIVFSLSNNELRFACQKADCYEIIYVVIGEDGKPAHQPWRLGHLFKFEEGEDLLHNSRFSIESDNYCISASPIENDTDEG